MLRPWLVLTLLAVAVSNALASCGKQCKSLHMLDQTLMALSLGQGQAGDLLLTNYSANGVAEFAKNLLHKMTRSWKKGAIKIYLLWLTSKPCTQLGGCLGKPLCTKLSRSTAAGIAAGWAQPHAAVPCACLSSEPHGIGSKTPLRPAIGKATGFFPVHMAAFPITTVFGSTTDLSGLLTNEVFWDLSAG